MSCNIPNLIKEMLKLLLTEQRRCCCECAVCTSSTTSILPRGSPARFMRGTYNPIALLTGLKLFRPQPVMKFVRAYRDRMIVMTSKPDFAVHQEVVIDGKPITARRVAIVSEVSVLICYAIDRDRCCLQSKPKSFIEKPGFLRGMQDVVELVLAGLLNSYSGFEDQYLINFRLIHTGLSFTTMFMPAGYSYFF